MVDDAGVLVYSRRHRVFVGGISPQATEKALADYFGSVPFPLKPFLFVSVLVSDESLMIVCVAEYLAQWWRARL